jgi:S1-C subfamily serine protease
MKAAAAEGLGFAIPVDTVKQLLSEMSRWGWAAVGSWRLLLLLLQLGVQQPTVLRQLRQ